MLALARALPQAMHTGKKYLVTGTSLEELRDRVEVA